MGEHGRAFGSLLLTDARLPVGGHAYSGSLEPALAAGMSLAQIPDFLRARLHTVGVVDAAAAVLAHRAARTDVSQLLAVHDALLARTPSAPLREISGMLGRGLSRMATRLWPEHEAVQELVAIDRAPQRPVALGVIAALMGTDEAALARASLYDDGQTITSAVLKLQPVDPMDTVAWILDLEPEIEPLVDRIVSIGSPDDLPALTAPEIEQWSLDHAQLTRRIFIA